MAAFLLAPMAMLMAPAGGVDRQAVQDREVAEIPARGAAQGGEAPGHATQPPQPQLTSATPWPFRLLMHGFDGGVANQVRIEQRMTIRISPRAPIEPNMLAELPGREIGPKFIERKIGKCLPVARIAGVQAGEGSRLILYMRDQRIVSAELERACRSRDFYSGFYLSRSDDGMLCIDRDTLLSRSGANCKLTRFRQLVEAD